LIDIRGRLQAALADRYCIERELGRGGMATVYLARDIRHGRNVAVKVLRPELAAVIGAERFLAEIRLTASLQHPHILPLHDSGEADSFLFYVMPHVAGESLRDRLSRERQLPIADAVRIATDIASALDYAHRHGVIHRDIKPENILLHDGSALMADFGIALAVTSAGGTRLTETGMSLGTPHYMSPEQAMGEREITARSDVYALGAVIYEMLIGEPPFTGPTAQSIVAKVMTAEPTAPREQRKTIPPHVEEAVLVALQKLPADRFASAGELAEALRGSRPVPRPTGEQTASAPFGHWPARLGWTLVACAAVLGLAIGAGGAIALSRAVPREAKRSVARFTTHVPAGTHLPDVPGTSFALSPDGNALVYVGQDERGTRLFVKRLDELDATAIPGTADATSPLFSPDGRWVAFSSPVGLQRVLLAGGPVEAIARAVDRGADWGTDGMIAFVTETGLQEVPADGGQPKQLTKLAPGGSITHGWPCIVPTADAVLFSILDWSQGLQGAKVAAVSRRTGEVRTLVEGAFSARVLPSGYLVFARANGTLEAVRFDARRLALLGRPTPVLEGVRVEPGGETDVAISRTGSLVYLPASTINRRVMRVDREGHATPLLNHTAFYEFPTLSPDGKHLAVRVFEPSGLNLWVYDLERGAGVRLTSGGATAEPAWSRDDHQVVVGQVSSGVKNANWVLYSVAADGSGIRDTLLAGQGLTVPGQWTPDGRQLVMTNGGDIAPASIALLTPGDSAAVRPLVPGAARLPALSPDGRWLAYVSDQAGREEVYVRRFKGAPRQWAVSTDGGSEPRWGPDGRELFYRWGRQVRRVSFREAGGEAVLGAPAVMFEIPYVTMAGSRMWDVAPSGQWFVMVEGHEVFDEFITVLDWFDEVEKRVGQGSK
jgi:Tol biopolymer transport system component